MGKYIYIITILILLPGVVFCQLNKKNSKKQQPKTKAAPTVVIKDTVVQVPPEPMYIFTGFGSKKYTELCDGFRISGGISSRNLKMLAVNDAAYLPLYSEGSSVSGYSVSAEIIKFPFSMGLTAAYYSQDISTLSTLFPLPPPKPDGTGPGENKLNTAGLSLYADWIPGVLLWNYLFPSVGAGYSYSFSENQGRKSSLGAPFLKTGILLRYKLLYVNISYKKFIISENYDDQLDISMGVWILKSWSQKSK